MNIVNFEDTVLADFTPALKINFSKKFLIDMTLFSRSSKFILQ